MRKHLLPVFMVILFSGSVFAQPAFNPVEKGNRQAGIQMLIANTDMFRTENALKLNDFSNLYGLHVAGSYGWFVDRGLMIGVQTNIGFYHLDYGSGTQYGVEADNFDISLAPMTRYYFSVDKKHRFKPFLLAGIPIVYSGVKKMYIDNSWRPDVDENYLELRSVFGFGAAYFGKAGSIELNISNMGFFLGVHKFIQPRKK
jgi:hypothetical protein